MPLLPPLCPTRPRPASTRVIRFEVLLRLHAKSPVSLPSRVTLELEPWTAATAAATGDGQGGAAEVTFSFLSFDRP